VTWRAVLAVGLLMVHSLTPASSLTRARSSCCTPTLPNRQTPPNELSYSLQHGNGALWTELWPEGTVLIPPDNVAPDGHLFMKWPWWRRALGQQVTVEGQRLDAPALPLAVEIPEGYGAYFQATTLIFPSEGCWEITAKSGDDSLTIMVLVQKEESASGAATPVSPSSSPCPSPSPAAPSPARTR